MRAKIAKWGNSLALRLPKEYVSELGLSEGAEVELGREGTKMVAETKLEPAIPRYRIEDLVAEMKRLGPEAVPETVEWGPDVGSEILPDDAYSRGEITPDDLRKKNAS